MSSDRGSQDELIGELIRSAGRGPSASPEAKARVYSTVHAAWRQSFPERRPRRRALVWLAAAAATLPAAALLVVLQPPAEPQPLPVIASFEKITGSVELVYSSGDERRLRPESTGAAIKQGASVRTRAGGGAGIRLAGGLVLRVNEESEVQFTSSDVLALGRGTLYVDSGADGTPGMLEVRTGLGSVRHVGTQYEVRLDGRNVRVRVREGAVVFRDAAREVVADAGEQISIPETGAPVRSTLPLHDPAWDWVEHLAVLDGGDAENVGELLGWVVRETGRTLRYVGSGAEAEAARLTLHGVGGLTPAEVLDVIAETTSLRYAEEGGELLVLREP